ncbi:16S rRNA (cytosine(1402)-N(4))-methyltransferase RsmH [Mycoplasma mycoides]|uniref:16S rRNA (cytosine(1402)-N(4))-methyltransferase RsmH n=1 Tax=Mycoplasma mycoides TaxID=2102 RepID=UPI0022405620|nr:16S rRNA (cytosine(1402)-N(4))-methyltransferase RsmH [Mycoplasma mycoides]QVK05694.1 16S rRNA (cytosine(1402)-N(4))-methyltransferase RsmH [Mycoplasma mycoides subsp. capri]QVK08209.1 16S rRNA (cytosine(1402)-N(4))-methyltransferase RsmH [Mycoplasma mycoides subsp. capri]QVK09658.1 16S rRNA (cytosine(1402)-N(4))-methyltransferase RsmH [Mycoplasma mycoides subsp. capri]
MDKHIPVLLKESIEYLNIKPDGIYVDCTLGRAGHSSEILKNLDQKGFLYAIDQDQIAIDQAKEKLEQINNNFLLIQGNFSNLSALLAINHVFNVDGILYDLGVSSPQIDIPSRGFSYKMDGPLDMRMDLNSTLTAHQVINTYSESQISEILFKYGEESFSKSISKKIVESRPINSTLELVEIIKSALPQKVLKQKKHPAKKTFQALRIYINNELIALENSLKQALDLLNSKARICVITFHSLEEKIVKNIFNNSTNYYQEQLLSNLPIKANLNSKFKLVIKKPIKPSLLELEQNHRSHSAKLWVIEKN